MRDDNERDLELTAEEAAALAGLRHETAPPPELEDRVVAALRRRGLIRAQRAWTRAAAIAATLLLALAVGLSGFWLGARSGTSFGSGAPAALTFALLVYDPVAGTPAVAGGDAVAEATAWATELARQGVLTHAEKLRDDGRRLTLRDGAVQLIDAFPPPGDDLVLGGFFLIRAAGYEEAQRIAADCPLLRHGSTIEIRAFD